jgi:hypothetical protein
VRILKLLLRICFGNHGCVLQWAYDAEREGFCPYPRCGIWRSIRTVLAQQSFDPGVSVLLSR